MLCHQVEDIQDGIDFSDMDRGWHPKHLTYADTDWDDQPLEVNPVRIHLFGQPPHRLPIAYMSSPPPNHKIVLVPHSHVDPGWIKTLQQYFDDQAKHILDTVIEYLQEEPFRTFIWAEMSYLQMWWEQASEEHRVTLRRLVQAGRFEIVTGGWVMTDEASAHVFGMVDQLIEGQLWLNRTLGVTPRTGWSIDPFGQSPTMAFINNRAGMKGMVIDRIHWRLKQFMQRTENLVFRWRQQWDDAAGSTDIVTHTLPFYLYDVHYSCGPDYATCCQLDFGYPYFINRPAPMCQEFGAKVMVRPLGEGYEATLAADLLREYRKMAKLYRRNVVLHPVGGDFRYVNRLEIHAMLDSYTHLMKYVNAHPELHTTMRFGTLSDYFERLAARGTGTGSQPGAASPPFSPLSGDFFPYSDRKDHHWSGFFSTRSSFKRLTRQLEVTLRAAEIQATLALADRDYRASAGAEDSGGVLQLLTTARRALALFMHHDAITGTSKEHVMQDYEHRLLDGLLNAEFVLHGALASRLGRAWGQQVTLKTVTTINIDREPTPQVLTPRADQPIFLVVPSALTRDATVPIRVLIAAGLQAEIVGLDGSYVAQQMLPLFASTGQPQAYHELWFCAKLPALGAAIYQLRALPDNTAASPPTVVNLLHSGEIDQDSFRQLERSGFQIARTGPTAGPLILESSHLKAQVDPKTGLLLALRQPTDLAWVKVLQTFQTYSSRVGEDEHSGAYLFMPKGGAEPYVSLNRTLVRITEGPMIQQVDVLATNYHQKIRLFRLDESHTVCSFAGWCFRRGLTIQGLAFIASLHACAALVICSSFWVALTSLHFS